MQQKGSNGGAESETPVQTDGTYLLLAVAACTGPNAPEDQGHQTAPARQHSFCGCQHHGGEPEGQGCVLQRVGGPSESMAHHTQPTCTRLSREAAQAVGEEKGRERERKGTGGSVRGIGAERGWGK